MYKNLVIETSSLCNRTCSTCMRNSYPDREFVKSWFQPNFISLEMIKNILAESKLFEYNWRVTLAYYNEPLLDTKIIDIIKLVKSYGFWVKIITNGDFLSGYIAQQLDGLLDNITISLYGDKKSQKNHFRKLFSKTKTLIKTRGHRRTHYSPNPSLPSGRCTINNKLIINHKCEYMLCCDDFGVFGLGRFPDVSLKDYWYGEKRVNIVNDILHGNRDKYGLCKTCTKR